MHLDIDGSINNRRLVYLTRLALRRELPDRTIIDGLGELSARCSSDLETLVLRAFGRRRMRFDGATLVAKIAAPDLIGSLSVNDWYAVSMEQSFASTKLDQDIVACATDLLENSYRSYSRAYGLLFSIRVALQLSPASTLSSLIQKPEGRVVPLLQALVKILCESANTRPQIEALLRCKNSLLRVMGALTLSGGGWFKQDSVDMLAIHGQLLAAGWTDIDAHWIVAQRLKNVAHERFRVRRHVADLETQQARHRRMPTRRPADIAAEQEKVAEQRLEEARKRCTGVEAQVKALVELLAKTWPTLDVAEETCQRIDPCMIDSNEIRLEVAQALPPNDARRTMLDLVLQKFEDLIGLREPEKALEEYFFVSGADVVDETRIAASALVMRYEHEQTKIGRRAGQRIDKLSKAAQKILSRPFARARNHCRYQSAMARLACALDFALDVANLLRIEHEKEARTLATLAVDHATHLLLQAPDDEDALPYLEQLACHAIRTMQDGLAPDKRAEWACDSRLPSFVRALAAWTDPIFVANSSGYAMDLFRAAGKPALKMCVKCFSYYAAITLLDAALAVHRADRVMIATIQRMWVDVEVAFAPYPRDIWLAKALLETATTIANLKADPTARQTFLAKIC
ncbi:hypothetical protein [Acetobacter malorum]|uniref:hypothetical protein n=1 Tax=Acetobacter malorum TaxID=178901 RepID=UPI0039E734F2